MFHFWNIPSAGAIGKQISIFGSILPLAVSSSKFRLPEWMISYLVCPMRCSSHFKDYICRSKQKNLNTNTILFFRIEPIPSHLSTNLSIRSLAFFFSFFFTYSLQNLFSSFFLLKLPNIKDLIMIMKSG